MNHNDFPSSLMQDAENLLALARRCHEIGITESDYVATLVETSLFGEDHVRTVQEQRLKAVCGRAGFYPGEAR